MGKSTSRPCSAASSNALRVIFVSKYSRQSVMIAQVSFLVFTTVHKLVLRLTDLLSSAFRTLLSSWKMLEWPVNMACALAQNEVTIFKRM